VNYCLLQLFATVANDEGRTEVICCAGCSAMTALRPFDLVDPVLDDY